MNQNRISNIENYLHRGQVNQSQGKLDEARMEFNKIIEINPNLVMGYCSRGCVYLQQENWDMAVADFNRVISIAPGFGFAYFNRAHAYIGKMESDRAWEDIQKAMEMGFNVKPEILESIEKSLFANQL